MIEDGVAVLRRHLRWLVHLRHHRLAVRVRIHLWGHRRATMLPLDDDHHHFDVRRHLNVLDTVTGVEAYLHCPGIVSRGSNVNVAVAGTVLRLSRRFFRRLLEPAPLVSTGRLLWFARRVVRRRGRICRSCRPVDISRWLLMGRCRLLGLRRLLVLRRRLLVWWCRRLVRRRRLVLWRVVLVLGRGLLIRRHRLAILGNRLLVRLGLLVALGLGCRLGRLVVHGRCRLDGFGRKCDGARGGEWW